MKKRPFRIYLILTLLWTAGIFLHSAMPAAASNAESGGVLAVVQMILPWITHGVLRKAAHFLEFAVLGILLTGTFHGARNFTLAKPMLFAVLTVHSFFGSYYHDFKDIFRKIYRGKYCLFLIVIV